MQCATGDIATLHLKRTQPSGDVPRMPVATLVPEVSEVFGAASSDAAATGFILSHLPRGCGPILWVQDRQSRRDAGRPYLPSLDNRPLLYVSVSRPIDVLWAIEEGLRCAALACVIGEVWGDPPALNFTATKRLSMRSEHYKVPCWLLRHAASPDLSAARNRWRLASVPSQGHPADPKSPGAPRWQAELFRTRNNFPGTWVATHDRGHAGAADRVHFSAPLRDGALAAGDGTAGDRAAG